MKTRKLKTRLWAGGAALGFFMPFNALATTLAPNFTLDGRLFNAAGTAASTDTVDFTVGIYSPGGTCLLYEQKTSSVDLSQTDGFYRLTVGSNTGSASRTSSDPGKTIAAIFSNSSQIRADDSVTTQTCPGGYTPAAGDQRLVRITVMPHSTGVPETLSPDLTISPVPHATVAESVQGLTPELILQITGNSSPYVFNKADIDRLFGPVGPAGTALADASTMHHHDSLYARIGGDGSMNLSSGALLGLGSRASDPTGLGAGDAGKTWYDSSSNVVKFWDGSAVQTLGAGGGGGVASVASAGVPITIGGTTTAPTIGITQASSGSSGYLAGTDFLSFSSKFGSTSTLNSGNIWVGNGSNNPAAVALSGDASLSSSGALTVSGLRGTTISSTAPTANQVLQFDGTEWKPSTFSESQWTTSGSNIYYNSGNVGIGTASPTAILHAIGTPGTAGTPNGADALNAVGGVGYAASNGTGGNITLASGSGGGTGAGGSVSISAGSGNGATGGTISIAASHFNSGAITLKPGKAGPNGSTAALNLYGGDGGQNTNGGIVNIVGGMSGSAGSGGESGGAINLVGGAGTGTNKNGGDVVINGGAKTGTGTNGDVLLATLQGNVGIGTTDPTDLLTIVGNSVRGQITEKSYSSNQYDSAGILIYRARGTVSSPSYVLANDRIGHFLTQDGTTPVASSAAGLEIYASEDHSATAQGSSLNFTVVPNGTTGAVAAMKIDQNGNVGIGITAPISLLHANNGNNLFSALKTGNAFTITSYAANGTEGRMGVVDSNTFGIQASNYNDSSPRALVLDPYGGNVGIGTTAPVQKLQVGASGDGTVAIANAWNTFSDLRLKRDLQRIPNACDIVDQLNGYYYYWKEGKDSSRQVGVIAQEVESVLPELVKTGQDGIKTVDYPKLTAVLIEASKELKAKTERLEAENAQIKAWACQKDPSAPFCK